MTGRKQQTAHHTPTTHPRTHTHSLHRLILLLHSFQLLRLRPLLCVFTASIIHSRFHIPDKVESPFGTLVRRRRGHSQPTSRNANTYQSDIGNISLTTTTDPKCFLINGQERTGRPHSFVAFEKHACQLTSELIYPHGQSIIGGLIRGWNLGSLKARATSSLIVHPNHHRIPRDLSLTICTPTTKQRGRFISLTINHLFHVIALLDEAKVRDFHEVLRPSAGIQHQMH